ncbi:MAG: DMT family transporter [Peptococcaceae bacterium]|nr:DMT family transporter [Peptococcaceae bacterium]
MKKESNVLYYLMLFMAPVMWGGTFTAAKYVVMELHPLVGASLRFMISFLFLLPILLKREGVRSLPSRKDLPILAFLGLTGIFLYNIGFFYGMETAAATDGALVVASGPVVTAILSVLLLKEKFSFRQGIGFLLCFLGVTTIVAKGSWTVIATWAVNHGDLLLFGSAVSFAFYTVAGKKAMARVSPMASTTFATGFGALMLTLLALPYYSWNEITRVSMPAVMGLLYLAILGSGVAFLFWFFGVNRVGAGTGAVFINFVPVWSAITAMVFLDERLALYHLVGAALIISGVYLVTAKKKRAAEVGKDELEEVAVGKRAGGRKQ